MKLASILPLIFPMVILVSPSGCEAEYSNDSRIYVEGKLNGNNISNLPLKITSGKITITETNTDSNGSFKMGGPGTSGEKYLIVGRKINSFQSNIQCNLTYDSTAIVLPTKATYFNFSQINIEP